MPKLDAAEREATLGELSGWTFDADTGAITRRFKFRDFSEAFGFMTRAAIAAELPLLNKQHNPRFRKTPAMRYAPADLQQPA